MNIGIFGNFLDFPLNNYQNAQSERLKSSIKILDSHWDPNWDLFDPNILCFLPFVRGTVFPCIPEGSFVMLS